ncbi:methyltransferase [Variovorax sp. RA8]|uniref:methyltransferase n=1 Tax=Variovorax sp. (strain JCM 16519 / RA8) TaxID=662548 RepID=UPI0013A568B1|nr:methyltransferase [Variovorax sp. RA8]
MWLSLPNNGKWRQGAFGGIDATPDLMSLFGRETLYHVVGNDTAASHYYVELVERVDGAHDLYLKYQHILGSRLLGGVSDEQMETLRARFEGRLPLPEFKAGPVVAHAREVPALAAGNARIGSLLNKIQSTMQPPAAQIAPAEALADQPNAARAMGRSAGGAPTAVAPAQAVAPALTLDGAALPDAAGSRGRRIDKDVLAVLRAGRTEDNKFFLGPEQLDPKLYKRVNAVLKDLGGAWKGGKTRAHVFEGAADEAVAAVIASGEYLTAKDFGFFPTPAGLADRAVAMAGLAPGMKVLEPSAGDGSLALRAAAIVGAQNVTACEFLDRNVAKLKAAGLTDVIHGDFLATDPAPIYDAVIMNPPFGNLQDVRHVEHAARFLKPDGVLIAITSPSYQHRNTAAATAFRDFMDAAQADAEDIPAGTFRESGTEVATVLLKMDACNFPWHLAEEDQQEEAEEEPEELAEAPRG